MKALQKSLVEDRHHPYLDVIFRISETYIRKSLSESQYFNLYQNAVNSIRGNKRETIDQFVDLYHSTVKDIYQSQHAYDLKLDCAISESSNEVKLLWGNCLDFMRRMKSESVQLMVTSPPYYNARDYSQWLTLDHYLDDMSAIIKESYRVLDNHRPFVFNVGDIFDNDHRHTKSSWGKRRIPLGAYFTSIFEDAGYQFVDDFIWDKGEVQTQRHKNGSNPYPLYQYPINCYEHIFVFYKHRLDQTLYPCPVCGCLKVNGNAYSGVGIKSWECKNLKCMERSAANRGKRFSARMHIMHSMKEYNNLVPIDLLKRWRRDIVELPPVIKINSKGENTLGHTAPFPAEIPKYAINSFTGQGDTVLDPFAGSFTTAVETKRYGRNPVGIELNKCMFRNSVLTRLQRELGIDERIKEIDEVSC